MPKKRGTPKKLAPKRARFAAEYLIDLNGTQAAIRAGFAPQSANRRAYEMLQDPRVQVLVQAGREKAAKRAEIRLDDIVAEASKIAFANMADYMTAGKDGDAFLDFSKLTREQAAALQELTVDDYVEGRGDNQRKVKRVKFRLGDKLEALIALGKHLGGFGSKLEISGPGGAPLEMRTILTKAELTADERRGLREMLLRRAGQPGPSVGGVG
jgi:phage terminase small subunit